MHEWERDPTDNDFGCLFQQSTTTTTTPLLHQTIQLCHLNINIEAASKEEAHTSNQTGLMAWEGGQYLAEFVLKCPQLFRDKVVVELGAGSVPLPSIAMWHCVTKALLVSDGSPECVKLAKQNMLRNVETGNKSPPLFTQVIWGADFDLSEVFEFEPNLDWILAADVTYSEQGTQDFFNTVARIALHAPCVKLLLAFVERGVSEGRIIEIAANEGLHLMPFSEELTKLIEKMHVSCSINFKLFSSNCDHS